ncbi:aspartate kinase [Nonlabens dokdonensis]|uniref:Aspartokinase n=2 Tax=Nonlabens dokdonensis TaxID=328515 RepID=L7W9M4_NONDD|nr:aspartate kinase [Nonlabens dokdonensis]AGC76927.1 aspartokinase [Nonlabens dokdonensis DSW-6]PZX36833.1 aspartate kinase [Nonlabens dokdonensis]
MRIFKFGGASVKDAAGVRNVCKVLNTIGYENTGIVVSAMGKTTNALEEIIERYLSEDTTYVDLISHLYEEHMEVIGALEQPSNDQESDFSVRFRESGIKKDIKYIIESLTEELLRNKSKSYSFLYDQVVSHGELMSTKIVAAYLNECGIPLQWKDAREFIKTDNKYRDAAVKWKESEKLVKKKCGAQLFITQGFIGSDDNGFTTTLGREGSDYTAAILAYCLDADSVTIWKDVPGVLNADPRAFQNTVLLQKIPYNEAIELAFYGASVIHPKTLQPLQGKKIPLYVKSFLLPEDEGTVITDAATIDPFIPCYIVRKNMVFMKISSRDFSFIGENNISDIFQELSEHKMQVGLLQNSAISFSLCVEDKYNKLKELLADLESRYKISHVTGVSLYTVRHYNEDAMEFIEAGKEVLLKQRAQETLQLIVKE